MQLTCLTYSDLMLFGHLLHIMIRIVELLDTQKEYEVAKIIFSLEPLDSTSENHWFSCCWIWREDAKTIV